MTVGKEKIIEMLETEGDNYMQQCENDEKKVKALNKKVVGEKVTKEEEEAGEQLEEDEVLGAVLDREKKEKKLESQKKKNKGHEGKEKQGEDEEEKEEEEAEDDEYDPMTMALTHIHKKVAAEEVKEIKYKYLVQNVEEKEWYINQHDNEAADIANIGSDA
jgi:hypothetical protein